MDNLTLIAIVIIVVWLFALGFYFYISRQQKDIVEDMDELRESLDESEDGEQ
jgi:preprotein translocase subunit YajC